MPANAQPMEPWFFEITPPFALNDDEKEKIDTLTAAGRAIVQRMVEHIALNENMAWDAVTPGFADTALDRVRDAIAAARNVKGKARPNTDLEELGMHYMEAMRLWLLIYGQARDRE